MKYLNILVLFVCAQYDLAPVLACLGSFGIMGILVANWKESSSPEVSVSSLLMVVVFYSAFFIFLASAAWVYWVAIDGVISTINKPENVTNTLIINT